MTNDQDRKTDATSQQQDNTAADQVDALFGMIFSARTLVKYFVIGIGVLFIVTGGSSIQNLSHQHDAGSAMALAWASAQLACLLVCFTIPLCISWLLLRCMETTEVRFSTAVKGIGDFIGRGTGLGVLLGVALVAASVARPDTQRDPAHPMDLTIAIGVCSIGVALASVPFAILRELARATRDRKLIRPVGIGLTMTTTSIASWISIDVLHLVPSECFRYFLGRNLAPVISRYVERDRRAVTKHSILEFYGNQSISDTWLFCITVSAAIAAGLITWVWDRHRGRDRPGSNFT